MRFIRSILFAVILAAILSPAKAATRALLIGVSDYGEGLGIANLRGPKNDVRLLRETLTGLGVQSITVLAEIEGGRRPTRQAILAEFERLQRASRRGDLVIIHFSGHGSRQRDESGDKSDGVDEVFLPADTLPARPGEGLIRNAIVDDEIGEWVDRIRATGADVWLTIDACHAGTGLRGRNDGALWADRFADPAALGIEKRLPNHNSPNRRQTGDLNSDAAASDWGGVMAFYAARSGELARELNFGALHDDKLREGPWYGVFTARLARRLETLREPSFQQLYLAVTTDLEKMPRPLNGRAQSPTWEGTLADRVVFSGAAKTRSIMFRVNGQSIAAGMIHGLTPGSLINLYGNADQSNGQRIARAQITETTERRARFRFVGPSCRHPDPDSPCAEAAPPAKTAHFADVERLSTSTTVTITQAAQDAAPEIVAKVRDAINHLNAAGTTSFVFDREPADVYFRTDGNDVWFGRATEIEGVPTGLRWTPREGGLNRILERIYGAERLAQHLVSIRQRESILNPLPVEISGKQRASAERLLAPRAGVIDPITECRRIAAAPDGYGTAQDLMDGANVKQCDRLDFHARGLAPGAWDINQIHIDSAFCATNRYARVEGDLGNMPIGPPLVACSDCPGGYSAGLERTFFLVGEVKTNGIPLNLTGLIETCNAAEDAPARRGGDLSTVLRQLTATRNAPGEAERQTTWMRRFEWMVRPRAVVLRDGNPSETTRR